MYSETLLWVALISFFDTHLHQNVLQEPNHWQQHHYFKTFNICCRQKVKSLEFFLFLKSQNLYCLYGMRYEQNRHCINCILDQQCFKICCGLSWSFFSGIIINSVYGFVWCILLTVERFDKHNYFNTFLTDLYLTVKVIGMIKHSCIIMDYE